jgi:hypothetical protein
MNSYVAEIDNTNCDLLKEKNHRRFDCYLGFRRIKIKVDGSEYTFPSNTVLFF